MIAKKSFGQHFLRDHSVIEKIIVAAEITPGETIVEVGPGHGVLTEALVESGAKVIAVEADRDLIPELEAKFGESARIIFSDILKLPIADLGKGSYKVVANLPYNIASAVMEKFLSSDHPPTTMVVMVQREVADRMMAKAGEMSVLSVACQIYADQKRVTNVPPGAFSPPPKVESTVVRLSLRTTHDSSSHHPPTPPRRGGETQYQGKDYEAVISLAKIGFRSRRKLLKGNLLAGGWSKEVIADALAVSGLNPLSRPQELSVDDWQKLWYNLHRGYGRSSTTS